MAFEPWFAIALTCNFAGYATYWAGLRRNRVQPNRASWLIWSAATGIEALTYLAVNPGTLQGTVLLFSSLACLAVTAAIWRRSQWAPPSAAEGFCMAASLTALILWLIFQEAFWAHMLVVATVPISFWPTWASAWAEPGRERSIAWPLWAVGDFATLLVALRHPTGGVGEFAYLVVEFSCHAAVCLIIVMSTTNPLRHYGWQAGWMRIFGRPRSVGKSFRVGASHLGRAVYAAREFAISETLIEFTGRRFRADQVPSLMRGSHDRFVQVTPDHYMGPSGRIDDLINHSCDPNAGLRFTDEGVFLVAVRDIAPGEEITWDYSTTLAESNWHMICQCRTEKCRRVIGNFSSLAPDRQEWFRAHNLVAPYLRRKDDVAPPPQPSPVRPIRRRAL